MRNPEKSYYLKFGFQNVLGGFDLHQTEVEISFCCNFPPKWDLSKCLTIFPAEVSQLHKDNPAK